MYSMYDIIERNTGVVHYKYIVFNKSIIVRQNRELFLDDLDTMKNAPCSFIYVDLIEVNKAYRHVGIGSKVLQGIMAANQLPVIVKVGCTSEEEYNSIEGSVKEYLYDTKVSFYIKNGFVDVNNSSLGQSEYVMMAWPESFAVNLMEE